MARFTFSSGNTQKLFFVPLYALGRICAVIVARSRDAWVIGSGIGVGEGALALYRRAMLERPELRMLWLASSPAEMADARSKGIPVAPKASARGFWSTLRAEVVVVTHGLGDVNRFGTSGAFVVQLWHGIPLKLLQLDSPATFRSGILPRSAWLGMALRRAYRRSASAISLLPAASEVAARRLRTAFGLPASTLAVTGDPRDDVLCGGTAHDRRELALALVHEALAGTGTSIGNSIGTSTDLAGRRILLYAPTWRDGEPDPGIPTDSEWTALEDFLERTRSTLLVRPHRLGVGSYRSAVDGLRRVMLLDSGSLADITPALPSIDALITDYSSIAYDFSLVGGPMFFLAPDEERYIDSRGLYEPYRYFSDSRAVRSWTAILEQLARFDADPEWAASVIGHTERTRARHHRFADGRNTERVLREITRRVDARR